LFSIIRVLFWSPDVNLIFNSANSPLAVIPKIFGKKVIINVDGLEWKRAKWGKLAKMYYKFSEFFSSVIADAVVSDAKAIKEYYRKKYKRESIYIPYGAPHIESKNPEILKQYGLKPDGYFFIGSRLEPENHQDMALEAFMHINTDKLLVIAGGANWESPYMKKISEVRSRKIKILGPVYTLGHIEELHANAYAYIHGNEVGGTNPALLKAMGSGNCVIALDVSFNREVLGDTGLYFQNVSELKRHIEFLLANQMVLNSLRQKTRERAGELYKWQDVINIYEKTFTELRYGKKKNSAVD
jgi:glycosyltransferase involved in cell wall biosynthesis